MSVHRGYRKGPGRAATLAYLGHVLLDNRHGLVANVCVTAETGTAEREAATAMLAASAPPGSTVGADKGYDAARFVDEIRALELTPHIARKTPNSAIDVGTTCHPGYRVSQRKRKLVEQVFGWMKTVGGIAEAAPPEWRTGRLERHLCRGGIQPGAIANPGGDVSLMACSGRGSPVAGPRWHRSPHTGG